MIIISYQVQIAYIYTITCSVCMHVAVLRQRHTTRSKVNVTREMFWFNCLNNQAVRLFGVGKLVQPSSFEVDEGRAATQMSWAASCLKWIAEKWLVINLSLSNDLKGYWVTYAFVSEVRNKLSKALAWFSCVRSHEKPEFYAWPGRTVTRADSANYMSIGVVNE